MLNSSQETWRLYREESQEPRRLNNTFEDNIDQLIREKAEKKLKL